MLTVKTLRSVLTERTTPGGVMSLDLTTRLKNVASTARTLRSVPQQVQENLSRNPITGKLRDGVGWYVLRVFPGREFSVQQTIEVFLQLGEIPHYSLVQETYFPRFVAGNRVQSHFPGYLFVRMVLTSKLLVYFEGDHISGCFGFLKLTPGLPPVIPNKQIATFKMFPKETEKLPLGVGDSVSVPFGSSTITGVVVDFDSQKVVVETVLFSRMQKITVLRENCLPVERRN